MHSRNSGRVGGCWSCSGGGGRGGRDDVRAAAGVRDEADVVQLENFMSAGEAPVDGGEEGVLEVGDLGGSDAMHAHIGHFGAEPIAVLLGGEGNGRYNQAGHSQGGYHEGVFTELCARKKLFRQSHKLVNFVITCVKVLQPYCQPWSVGTAGGPHDHLLPARRQRRHPITKGTQRSLP